jgi:hypothetical protein
MAAEVAHGSCTDVLPVRKQHRFATTQIQSPNWLRFGLCALRGSTKPSPSNLRAGKRFPFGIKYIQ